MKLYEYQEAVQRTCATSDPHETIKLALVGLQDELGEIAGPLKKYLWHGHVDLDRAHLQDELGDVLWYLTTLCTALDISLEQVLAGNIEKLRQRYPDGFSCQRSLHRSEEQEAGEGASLLDTPAPTRLRLKLWEATNEALDIPLRPSLEREDVTHLGLQLGCLLRVLARRFISPLDETTLPPPQEV